MCTLPLLAGENVSARFVVPTVAASIDLVVHAALERDGRRTRPRDRRGARPGRGRRRRDRRPLRPPRRRPGARRRLPAARRPLRTGRLRPVAHCSPRRSDDRSAAGAHPRGWGCSWSGGAAGSAPEQPVARARRAGPLDRLSDEIVQAGFQGLSVRTLLGAGVIAFLLVLALVQATVGVLPIAACFAAMAAYLPVGVVRARARRRRARLRDLWPDAVDNITSGVRAGMALPEALSQLGTRGPDELREPFRAFADDYRLTGRFHDSPRPAQGAAEPTPSATGSSRACASPARSAAPTSATCCAPCRASCARTPAPGPSSRPGSRWTVNAARLAVAAPWAVLAHARRRTPSRWRPTPPRPASRCWPSGAP